MSSLSGLVESEPMRYPSSGHAAFCGISKRWLQNQPSFARKASECYRSAALLALRCHQAPPIKTSHQWSFPSPPRAGLRKVGSCAFDERCKMDNVEISTHKAFQLETSAALQALSSAILLAQSHCRASAVRVKVYASPSVHVIRPNQKRLLAKLDTSVSFVIRKSLSRHNPDKFALRCSLRGSFVVLSERLSRLQNTTRMTGDRAEDVEQPSPTWRNKQPFKLPRRLSRPCTLMKAQETWLE